MELRHVRYFVMAAEEGSISSAAARLNISQPAVSRQIRDLEGELEVPLFERTSGGLILTDAGQVALQHAKELLRQSNTMKASVRAYGHKEKPIVIKIGYIATALPGFLADGLRKFNQVNDHVCVQIHEMTPQSQEKALSNGELDLGFMGHVCPELKRKYCVEAIQKVPMAIAVPDNHKIAERKTIDLAELGNETFLSLDERHFPGRPELMQSMFDHANISPKTSMKVNGLSELLGMIAGGAGIALIPSDVAQLPHARVAFIKLRNPKITLISSAVWRKENETTELVNLIAMLK